MRSLDGGTRSSDRKVSNFFFSNWSNVCTLFDADFWDEFIYVQCFCILLQLFALFAKKDIKRSEIESDQIQEICHIKVFFVFDIWNKIFKANRIVEIFVKILSFYFMEWVRYWHLFLKAHDSNVLNELVSWNKKKYSRSLSFFT